MTPTFPTSGVSGHAGAVHHIDRHTTQSEPQTAPPSQHQPTPQQQQQQHSKQMPLQHQDQSDGRHRSESIASACGPAELKAAVNAGPGGSPETYHAASLSWGCHLNFDEDRDNLSLSAARVERSALAKLPFDDEKGLICKMIQGGLVERHGASRGTGEKT
jgi:hypothetical protein